MNWQKKKKNHLACFSSAFSYECNISSLNLNNKMSGRWWQKTRSQTFNGFLPRTDLSLNLRWRKWFFSSKILLFSAFFFCCCCCFCLFVFLGPHLRHMGVPRLGVQLELLLPAYATATATQDPSSICDLHHSSWQHWILNPLSRARDRTRNLMVPSRIPFHCATTGPPYLLFNSSLLIILMSYLFIHIILMCRISFPFLRKKSLYFLLN